MGSWQRKQKGGQDKEERGGIEKRNREKNREGEGLSDIRPCGTYSVCRKVNHQEKVRNLQQRAREATQVCDW